MATERNRYEVRSWHTTVPPLDDWDTRESISPWTLSEAVARAREVACERGVWRVEVIEFVRGLDGAWYTRLRIGPLGCLRARQQARRRRGR